MNKFELINTTLMSNLAAENKTLLIELIMRSDDEGLSWPSVERLCKARGIKHEKNFKGADVYLEGLVTKVRKGRRNSYVLNVPAIQALDPLVVRIKHTDTHAAEGAKAPAVADDTPAVEGANSSKKNTEDSSEDSSQLATPTEDASRPPSLPSSNYDSPSLLSVGTITDRDTPAVEGVSSWEEGGRDWWYAEENNEMEKAR
ncbi:hypothetical protein GCM10011376_29890 [Nocardioides flavus (ex Wang et al. 2016)]|uniref:Helix-turn-helix domain-containing protein n=1 Tax=Nocardioides flavus (ex Wang et al. 2016) TaxID=2058780 RepID=A0ABQ3HQC8_9ACTN|nr:hypothetical protein [Nocardioides flavus (ex Wang et al. 2016)]GHE18379.1 hypothetical protein GCM10011376_29890 [Nocardioides flavus (ex Wang et al. 2016)]